MHVLHKLGGGVGLEFLPLHGISTWKCTLIVLCVIFLLKFKHIWSQFFHMYLYPTQLPTTPQRWKCQKFGNKYDDLIIEKLRLWHLIWSHTRHMCVNKRHALLNLFHYMHPISCDPTKFSESCHLNDHEMTRWRPKKVARDTSCFMTRHGCHSLINVARHF